MRKGVLQLPLREMNREKKGSSGLEEPFFFLVFSYIPKIPPH